MFKRYLVDVEQEKFKVLIKTINRFDFDETDVDGDRVPENKEIAELAGLPRAKTNQLITQLYEIIINKFIHQPPEITKVVHMLHITIPEDERRRQGVKSNVYVEDDRSLWISLKLAVTPKVGEEIELDFIDSSYYRRGYVHEVTHTITGHSQEIYVGVHPFRDEYYRWQKMKASHDDWARTR